MARAAILCVVAGLLVHASAGKAEDSPRRICSHLSDPDFYSDDSFQMIRPGKGDWLFRDSTDLIARRSLSGDLARDFSQLNARLAREGVHLIVFVAPPRGMMQRDYLTQDISAPHHFSADVAEQAYVTTLQRLRFVGVGAPNVLTDWRVSGTALAGTEKVFYLPGDPHWTPYAAYITSLVLARELARYPEFKTLPVKTFTSRLGLPQPLIQTLYREADRICGVKYHPEMRRMYFTQATKTPSDDLLTNSDVEVVLVGTSFSTVENANFSGFLRQTLKTDVANYAISGGGLKESIMDYLLSDDYAATKPKFLIWEMQYHNLDAEEYFPMILGAADGDCVGRSLVATRQQPLKLGQPTPFLFNMADRIRLWGAVDLVVDIDTPDARRYHIQVAYRDGLSDRFDIDAGRWSHPASRLIVRLPRDGKLVSSVTLVPDQKLTGTAAAHFCRVPA